MGTRSLLWSEGSRSVMQKMCSAGLHLSIFNRTRVIVLACCCEISVAPLSLRIKDKGAQLNECSVPTFENEFYVI